MKKQNLIYAFVFGLLLLPTISRASSLDELYRDIIRDDNQGYLPLFVKNRNIPDILIEEELLKQNFDGDAHKLKEPVPNAVYLTNNRRQKDQAAKAARLYWESVLQAVHDNRVTPVELDEINKRVQKEDPQATEILAWMNARGVGISPNLTEAFFLYQKAASLHVPNAAENATKVFKAMSVEQRRTLHEATEIGG